MTGCVNEIDNVLFAVLLVEEAYVCRLNGDASPLLFLEEVKSPGLSSPIGSHQAGHS